MLQDTARHLDIIQRMQDMLLYPRLPYIFPGVTIDAFKWRQQKLDSSFCGIVHPIPHLLDIFVGQIEGHHMPSLLLAMAMKINLLRLASPFSSGHHFDKIKLWEKTFLSPQEIIKKTYEELQLCFSELQFNAHLFYGRLNLDYNTFTYINCGYQTLLHFSLRKNSINFLKENTSNFETQMSGELHCTQMALEPGDLLVIGTNNLKSQFQSNLIPLITKHTHLDASELTILFKQELNSLPNLLESLTENANVLVVKINEDKQISSSRYAVAKFASDLAQLHAVRTFVRRVCQQMPGNYERLSLQLQLVINEIFCNIVKHSYRGQARGEIIIECQLANEGVYFIISDKGDSFNPVETKYPNLDGNQESGFGIFIIQQITDQVSYKPKTQEDRWNHVRIFKRYFSEEDLMECSHHIQENILIITPKEESLDAKNAPSFKEGVLNLMRTAGVAQLVFDLSHLQFIDSSGLGTFLSIQRTLNTQGGTLKLANLNKPIRTMFEIVSMHRIFDIFNSIDEAVKSFNSL